MSVGVALAISAILLVDAGVLKVLGRDRLPAQIRRIASAALRDPNFLQVADHRVLDELPATLDVLGLRTEVDGYHGIGGLATTRPIRNRRHANLKQVCGRDLFIDSPDLEVPGVIDGRVALEVVTALHSVLGEGIRLELQRLAGIHRC